MEAKPLSQGTQIKRLRDRVKALEDVMLTEKTVGGVERVPKKLYLDLLEKNTAQSKEVTKLRQENKGLRQQAQKPPVEADLPITDDELHELRSDEEHWRHEAQQYFGILENIQAMVDMPDGIRY